MNPFVLHTIFRFFDSQPHTKAVYSLRSSYCYQISNNYIYLQQSIAKLGCTSPFRNKNIRRYEICPNETIGKEALKLLDHLENSIKSFQSTGWTSNLWTILFNALNNWWMKKSWLFQDADAFGPYNHFLIIRIHFFKNWLAILNYYLWLFLTL